jgi:Mn2+/Fe2+ NRAMP family transporter
VIVLITISLSVVQEMAARMGAVTGKGLAELIREQYGIRWSTLATTAFFLTTIGICISDFVGIGAALGLAGIPVQASVPVAAFAIWLLVVRGSYKLAERIFIAMTLPFFAYPVAALLAHPKWTSVLHHAVVPSFHLSSAFIVIFVATAGTTITPYMQFYLQSGVVERGAGREDLRAERVEAISGAIFADLIAAFIIVATGATLFVHGKHNISSAADAAHALRPLAGSYAELLFGFGLLGASLLAAAILPVTCAYVVSEALGYEKGLSHRPGEAPVFSGVITSVIVFCAGVAMIPGIPVISLLVGVQVVNGALLPVILIFLWRLARSAEVLGEYRNGPVFDRFAQATVAWTSALSLLLLVITIAGI